MMRAGASLTENRFFNNCGGKLFAKTGPILLDSNNMKARYGRKYIKPEDVQEYKVRYIGGVLQFL